jgi:hypothetical protein
MSGEGDPNRHGELRGGVAIRPRPKPQDATQELLPPECGLYPFFRVISAHKVNPINSALGLCHFAAKRRRIRGRSQLPDKP